MNLFSKFFSFWENPFCFVISVFDHTKKTVSSPRKLSGDPKNSLFWNQSSWKFLGWVWEVPEPKSPKREFSIIVNQSKIVFGDSCFKTYNIHIHKNFWTLQKWCFPKYQKDIWKLLRSEKFLRISRNIIDRWNFFSILFAKKFPGVGRQSLGLRNFQELFRNLPYSS